MQNYLEVYARYLISATKNAYSTDLDTISDGKYSKDKTYHFLSEGKFYEKEFWIAIKATVKKIQDNNACLLFDDTILHKPHSKISSIVSYYFDHSQGKSLKGVNILSCIYQISNKTVPINFRIIQKTKEIKDNLGNTKTVSESSKNQLLRDVFKTCKCNKIRYRYILADSWYSSSENFNYIHKNLNKHFVIAIKSN